MSAYESLIEPKAVPLWQRMCTRTISDNKAAGHVADILDVLSFTKNSISLNNIENKVRDQTHFSLVKTDRGSAGSGGDSMHTS